MEQPRRRSPLLPWYIGVAIIVAADIFVAREFFSLACQAPGIVAAGVVVVIPAVYLVLMYLTLKSQNQLMRCHANMGQASSSNALRHGDRRRINVKLNEKELRALLDVLDYECRAFATYDQGIRDFRAVRPFINIRSAEGRHIAALKRIHRYKVAMPGNPWPGKVTRYPDLDAACRAGVETEIADAALYDPLRASTKRPDILPVYEALREASQVRHLPAFRRCGGHFGSGTVGIGRRGRARPAHSGRGLP